MFTVNQRPHVFCLSENEFYAAKYNHLHQEKPVAFYYAYAIGVIIVRLHKKSAVATLLVSSNRPTLAPSNFAYIKSN